MSVIQIATIRPLPSHHGDVRAALEAVIARCQQEDAGCELYALHEADGAFVVVEKWADDEALAGHRRGPAMAELVTRIKDKLDGGIAVVPLTPVPVGTAEQGTL